MLEPNIHFGKVDEPLPDWRKANILFEDSGNDDDLPVSSDVASILGFDPDAETYDEYEYGLGPVIDGWEDVPRAPAGSPNGGQWVGEGSQAPTVTTLKDAKKALAKVDFSNDEMDAVAEYTGSDYYEINRSLRDKEDPILIDRLENVKKNLDAFLQKAPKFQGTSYRGISFLKEVDFNEFANSLKEGSVLTDLGFLSTTADHSQLDSFISKSEYNVRIEILGKKGVYLANLSSQEDEKEILFPRKTKFKVKSIERNKTILGLSRNINLLLTIEEL